MEDDWDPKQYEIVAFCSLLENPRAPVELDGGSSGLLALLMGSYLGARGARHALLHSGCRMDLFYSQVTGMNTNH